MKEHKKKMEIVNTVISDDFEALKMWYGFQGFQSQSSVDIEYSPQQILE